MSIKKTISTLSVLATLGLTGCASAPEPVEPREFSENNSYAYNIANQTALTRNDSPLRDFTQEEIDEAKTNLVRKSGGDAALFFGSLRVLTGDFTGLIDVAGGSMANLANSGHIASESVFLITVKKDNFKTKLDAARYMVNTINETAQDTLGEYGEVKKALPYQSQIYTGTAIDNGKGEDIPFGLVSLIEINENTIEERTVNLDGREELVYSYGFDRTNVNVGEVLIVPPTPLIYSVEVEQIDYSEFYKDFTSQLPEGFYVYTPSFPRAHYDNKVYTDRSVIVPAIYTQGKKYEFIKPEVK
jgi:hypothetical protein